MLRDLYACYKRRENEKTAIAILIMLLYPNSSADSQNLDGRSYRPGVDPNIDMYMASWQESMPRKSWDLAKRKSRRGLGSSFELSPKALHRTEALPWGWIDSPPS